MAKFKVGDVVEILWVANPQFAYEVGSVGTVVKANVRYWLNGNTLATSDDGIYLAEYDTREHWCYVPDQLRLKRPPSWDQWLSDTSSVKDERPETEPVRRSALDEVARLYGSHADALDKYRKAYDDRRIGRV